MTKDRKQKKDYIRKSLENCSNFFFSLQYYYYDYSTFSSILFVITTTTNNQANKKKKKKKLFFILRNVLLPFRRSTASSNNIRIILEYFRLIETILCTNVFKRTTTVHVILYRVFVSSYKNNHTSLNIHYYLLSMCCIQSYVTFNQPA